MTSAVEKLRLSRLAESKVTSAVVYCRCSTVGQAERGLSIELQRIACLSYCEREGIRVIAVHSDEGISGKMTVKDRPGLAATIESTRENPGAIVIVHSLSRLGRSQKQIWDLLDERGEYALRLISVSEVFDTTTPMGRAFLGMLATFATLESDLATNRTKEGLAIARDNGTRLGAPAMIESTGDDGKRFVDPAKVALVRQIQNLYASQAFSHRTLAAYLNETGLASVKGAKWHPRTIRIALATALPPDAA